VPAPRARHDAYPHSRIRAAESSLVAEGLQEEVTGKTNR